MAALGLVAAAAARARGRLSAVLLPQHARCAGTSARGQLPKEGPAAQHLAALSFKVTRVQAAAAFEAWHRRTWLQRSAAQPAKEVFVPFWLGDATVEVNLTSAEVGERRAALCARSWRTPPQARGAPLHCAASRRLAGRRGILRPPAPAIAAPPWHHAQPHPLTCAPGKDELVQRYDRRTGRYDSRYETVWRRVELAGLKWQAHHAPESPEMQLAATWKYARCAARWTAGPAAHTGFDLLQARGAILRSGCARRRASPRTCVTGPPAARGPSSPGASRLQSRHGRAAARRADQRRAQHHTRHAAGGAGCAHRHAARRGLHSDAGCGPQAAEAARGGGRAAAR